MESANHEFMGEVMEAELCSLLGIRVLRHMRMRTLGMALP
jgi:hypothetical protein